MKDIVQQFPKIFKAGENHDDVNWYGIPKGWHTTVQWLCSCIQWHCDNLQRRHKVEDDRFQVVCVQVKEKFGGLRFYTDGNDAYVDGLISMADTVCAHTCIDCGTTHNVIMRNTGWISPLCDKCNDAYELRKKTSKLK